MTMTTKNTCSLLLVAVATAVICTSAVVCSSAPKPAPTDPSPSPSPCPWRTVPHPEVRTPFIQKLGSWAVDQQHSVLNFKKVVSAKWQGVGEYCGSMFFHNYNYELDIVAAIRGAAAGAPPAPGGDADQNYRAVVYVVNYTHPQKVISFKTVPPRPPTEAAPAQF